MDRNDFEELYDLPANFNLIASQRSGLKISVEEIAEKCGVSRQTVYNWEQGKTIPDVKYLNKLSEILQTDLGKLVAFFESK